MAFRRCLASALALLLATGAVPNESTAQGAPATSAYDLSRATQQPIPRDEFFRLWMDVALRSCARADERFHTTASDCARIVLERRANCIQSVGGKAPAMIGSQELVRSLGREFLDCEFP